MGVGSLGVSAGADHGSGSPLCQQQHCQQLPDYHHGRPGLSLLAMLIAILLGHLYFSWGCAAFAAMTGIFAHGHPSLSGPS